jgi:predicted amidophosphoribosyltransferase
LAENFARVLDLPYSKRVIIRNRYTRQQSKLNREDRLNNLNNSFKVRRNKIDKIDKEIVFLIDDVATS